MSYRFLYLSLVWYILYCSNPGHPFAAGVSLDKLSAVTVDETGKETFITGGALDRVQKVLFCLSMNDLAVTMRAFGTELDVF